MKGFDDHGFSLLELLVAMTLLGLLSVILFGSLKFGTQVWKRADDTTQEANNIRLAQSWLSRRLSRAYPLAIDENSVAFIGSARYISFLAADEHTPGALSRITIQSDQAELKASEQLELSNETSRRSKTLLRGKSLLFSYAAVSNDRLKWRNDWQGQDTLPALIRVSATDQVKPSIRWPDLVIAPRISAPAGCIFDPIRKLCRGWR